MGVGTDRTVARLVADAVYGGNRRTDLSKFRLVGRNAHGAGSQS